jgi:putative flippase GtrA
MAYLKFFKAQFSSFTATVIDFCLTIFLVEIGDMWYLTATLIGTTTGGAVNYIINRVWSFKSTKDKVPIQAFRYSHIWLGSILLNASGMWLLTSGVGIEYIISKLIVSLAVGWGFNYPLQKNYVFRKKIIVKKY